MIIASLKRYKLPLLILAAMMASITACKKLEIFEKNVSIPNYQWKYSFVPAFDFEITDTAARYNLHVVLRHTDAYRYNNIWLNMNGILEKDTLVKIPHIELPLGNDEKGWEGTGMNDIWEVRKAITKGPVQFKKAGVYHFTIAQVMREDPLPNVMSIGLRVEKVR
jgi:gliding motility-associated lipoprotein GldH